MSPRTDLGLTVAALAAGAVGTAGALAGAGSPAVPVLTGLLAPGLLAVAGAGALRRAGAIGRRTAAVGLALGLPALLCAVGGAASWSAGLDEADAGVQQGPLADAWLLLVLLGWTLGTAAVAPALAPLLHDIRSRSARALLASFVAGVVVFALGIALMLPAFAVLASVAALLLLTQPREARRREAGPAGVPWPPRVLAALAVVTAAGGAASLVVAFTGAAWPGFPGDGTRAMNVGLALAGLGAVPLMVAGGAVLRTLPRHRRSLAPVLAVAAVLAGSAAQAAGAGGSMQEPLLYTGAVLAGAAGALIVLPALPPFGLWQPVVLLALTVGLAAAAGLFAVVAVPVLAPAAAVVSLIVLRWRGRVWLRSRRALATDS